VDILDISALEIRPGRANEFAQLTEIELDAFETLSRALGTDRETHALPHEVLRESPGAGLLLVAADAADRPAGFLVGLERDTTLYVSELDVARVWQGNGVGRALVVAASNLAERCGYRGMTLTTDRLVPFNGPFYASLGFQILPEAKQPPFLRQYLENEIGQGMEADRRVAMALWFPAGA
jgi:GNAT superfamily N-acetyltransferase